jgi:hypothetical protein
MVFIKMIDDDIDVALIMERYGRGDMHLKNNKFSTVK